ncbi:MAG: response regulator [Bacteroides sp.]|nr:response regulator [Bacteroides sp.]
MDNAMNETERPLILVAEDDDRNFKLIKAIAGKKCNLMWARTGKEILDLYKQHRGEARLILMDIKMPEMTGLEATKAIREVDKEVPIAMQTAYAFARDREVALEAGANEVLVKPITIGVLRAAISRYIPEVAW